LATTMVIRLSGRTPAPVLRDWEITVPAGWLAVDRYVTLARSPRPASAAFAPASPMPTSLGTLTVAMVVVVGAVEVVAGSSVVTVGDGWLVVAGAADGPAGVAGSFPFPRATTPRTTEAAARPTTQRRPP